MPSLRQALIAVPGRGQTFYGPGGSVRLTALDAGTSLDGGLARQLAGRSILLRTREQIPAALALIELDGLARRVVLCPPELTDTEIASIIGSASIDTVICDADEIDNPLYGNLGVIPSYGAIMPAGAGAPSNIVVPGSVTEWLLLTSGTTGAPKLASHTFASLTGAIRRGAGSAVNSGDCVVWSTFYDIRRYGGLQIFLRAMSGGTSLVFSSAGEMAESYVSRLAAAGVTHISGTPSHWRRLLMSGHANGFAPKYVRLSGEIADQAILDALKITFPGAQVGHAFASTEAGVAFDVNDGKAGFPASIVEASGGEVEIKVVDGSLRIRSRRMATQFVGRDDLSVTEPDGFVDTGDMIELRDGRYYFSGRRGGIINVGGNKVHPEEIEAVINRHPKVRMALAKPKKNPISGAVVVADVVLRHGSETGEPAGIAAEILAICRENLPRYKVPAFIRIVPGLEVSPAGKLRRNA